MTSIVWPGTKHPEEDEVGNLKVNRIVFMKRVYECLPVRTCSIHFSLSNTPFYQMARTLFILSMPQFVKRMKFHVGKIIFDTFLVRAIDLIQSISNTLVLTITLHESTLTTYLQAKR